MPSFRFICTYKYVHQRTVIRNYSSCYLQSNGIINLPVCTAARLPHCASRRRPGDRRYSWSWSTWRSRIAAAAETWCPSWKAPSGCPTKFQRLVPTFAKSRPSNISPSDPPSPRPRTRRAARPACRSGRRRCRSVSRTRTWASASSATRAAPTGPDSTPGSGRDLRIPSRRRGPGSATFAARPRELKVIRVLRRSDRSRAVSYLTRVRPSRKERRRHVGISVSRTPRRSRESRWFAGTPLWAARSPSAERSAAATRSSAPGSRAYRRSGRRRRSARATSDWRQPGPPCRPGRRRTPAWSSTSHDASGIAACNCAKIISRDLNPPLGSGRHVRASRSTNRDEEKCVRSRDLSRSTASCREVERESAHTRARTLVMYVGHLRVRATPRDCDVPLIPKSPRPARPSSSRDFSRAPSGITVEIYRRPSVGVERRRDVISFRDNEIQRRRSAKFNRVPIFAVSTESP